jgi:MFS transporter, OFA family, oxalate/formate antiporter
VCTAASSPSRTARAGLVLAGALLVQLCLGAVYAWSVFTGELRDAFGFSAAQTQWVFGALLGTNALVMLLVGRLHARLGPRWVTAAGGLLFGGGFLLAGVLPVSFAGHLVALGVLAGAGMGLAYVGPIAVAMRWFPNRKGLITGVTVAGFGLGALVWVQAADAWGGLFASLGLRGTYRLFGALFLGGITLGAMPLAEPPEPARHAPAPGPPGPPSLGGAGPRALGRDPRFWLLAGAFLFSAMAGLMLIGVNRLFGRDALLASGAYPDLAAAAAAASTAYALAFALGNGLGRIAWGALADRRGWRPVFVGMLLAQGALVACFGWLGGSLLALGLGLFLTGFNYGANFALVPLATAQLFGAGGFARNYPWVNLAYGLAAVAGPWLAGAVRDHLEGRGSDGWAPAFWAAGGLCWLAAGLLALLRASPQKTNS